MTTCFHVLKAPDRHLLALLADEDHEMRLKADDKAIKWNLWAKFILSFDSRPELETCYLLHCPSINWNNTFDSCLNQWCCTTALLIRELAEERRAHLGSFSVHYRGSDPFRLHYIIWWEILNIIWIHSLLSRLLHDIEASSSHDFKLHRACLHFDRKTNWAFPNQK